MIIDHLNSLEMMLIVHLLFSYRKVVITMAIVILKLSLAAVAGLILGIEREVKHKPLGLKTCVVISIASCLLTIVSIKAAFDSHGGEEFIRADPMRLAAQIISGVGFLGAGVILRRSNDAISGLTTAAIVWAASGFGIAIGAGYYFEVAVGVVLLVTSVSLLPYVMKKYGPHSLREQEMRLNVYLDADIEINDFIAEIEKIVIEIKETRIRGESESQKVTLRCTVNDGAEVLFEKYNIINQLTGVRRTELESI